MTIEMINEKFGRVCRGLLNAADCLKDAGLR